LPVELADIPWLLVADAIDRSDEIRVRDRVRRLLQLPEILRQSRDRCRRIENDFGAVQPERARPFRKMPVIADVDANVGILRLEDGITEIARLEVELLPEPGSAVRDMILAILAEVPAVGVDHGGGVVVDT